MCGSFEGGPIRLALAALVSYAIVLAAYSLAYTSSHNLDVSSFIHAGDRLCSGCSDIYVYPNSDGYDGLFYYLLAKDPFNFYQLKDVASLGEMAYRHQRILYPLVVHLISFGNGYLIPYVMVVVNLFCLVAAVFIFQRMLSLSGLSAGISLAIPLVTGLFVSVVLDLAEPLWLALIFAAFYYNRLGKDFTASVLLALAFLAKETTIIMALPVLAFYLWRRRFGLVALYSFPLFVFLIWQTIIFGALGFFPLIKPNTSLRPEWLIEPFISSILSPSLILLPVVIFSFLALVFLVLSVSAVRARRSVASFVFLGNAIFILPLMTHHLAWGDLFSASRTILPLTVASLLMFAESGDRRILYALMPQFVMTLGLSAYYVLNALSAVF